jgi:hypothetical protein
MVVAEIAERQHGVIARRQLLELGISRDAIRRRLAAGRLHAVHAGVYAVGHRLLTVEGRWMAAVLACGDGATLSHRAAAAHWNLVGVGSGDIDVLVPGRGRSSRKGIHIHHVRSFDARDRRLRDGIPITSVGRTLFDFAEVASPRQVRHAWQQAERLRLLDTRQVARLCDGARGRRGLGTVRELLADRSEPPDTRFELERRFFEFCAVYDLPLPAVNVAIGPYTVDAMWAGARLVVELDSRAFHSDLVAFEHDRARDADLQVWGYRVIRVTWRRLENEPAEVAHVIRTLLGA